MLLNRSSSHLFWGGGHIRVLPIGHVRFIMESGMLFEYLFQNARKNTRTHEAKTTTMTDDEGIRKSIQYWMVPNTDHKRTPKRSNKAFGLEDSSDNSLSVRSFRRPLRSIFSHKSSFGYQQVETITKILLLECRVRFCSARSTSKHKNDVLQDATGVCLVVVDVGTRCNILRNKQQQLQHTTETIPCCEDGCCC